MDQNGGLIWNYLINGYVKSHPAVASDGTIYLAARDGKLYAINPNGTQKWEYATEKGVGTDFITAPSVAKYGTNHIRGRFIQR
ncbi:PQQ-binding-like beta-propeller repeat protein [Methanobacterium subterraneum]|uniref:PQQ-binding-like beta-propeller repeat protein n=1 Tax=Methanobacterium subterraneum TaxID=59277 RepID=UPI000C2D37C5